MLVTREPVARAWEAQDSPSHINYTVTAEQVCLCGWVGAVI